MGLTACELYQIQSLQKILGSDSDKLGLKCQSVGASIISDDISYYILYFFLKYSNVKYSTSAPILSYALKPDKFVKDAGSREIEFSAILPAASNSVQFPEKTENSYLLL